MSLILTPFIVDDGGRSAAGFKGRTGDCVCRAASIASGRPYAEIYTLIDALGSEERVTKRRRTKAKSSARKGVYKSTTKRVMKALGFKWTPTMTIGSGCKVHLRADELPPGRIVCSVSKHLVAVIDGVIHDTHDPSRDGTRCVYGYWSLPS